MKHIKIITAGTEEDFEDKVSEALEQGWRIIPGSIYIGAANCWYLSCAMVKFPHFIV